MFFLFFFWLKNDVFFDFAVKDTNLSGGVTFHFLKIMSDDQDKSILADFMKKFDDLFTCLTIKVSCWFISSDNQWILG